ncbi:7978_t:CDS:1 [Funneliformis geosporum]|uniref:7978_t:CDS:1 n=1 Tax=Funneliformis geosporum TaxID=1117311 RepID=A0A9W4TDN3_9GLOM|nr:7978_t:CDS:1 [Funneliformis geosporum]
MLEKHRSLRGTLTSKIKKSVFVVFSENILLPINTKTSALEISQ